MDTQNGMKNNTNMKCSNLQESVPKQIEILSHTIKKQIKGKVVDQLLLKKMESFILLEFIYVVLRIKKMIPFYKIELID